MSSLESSAREALPKGWRTARLTQLGEVNRGRSRHRPRYAAHLYGGPYPFIQTGDIKASGGRVTKHEQTYSEAGLEQSRLWPSGTMVITIAANIADTALLTYPACFPDSVIGFIADESHADVRFVEYMFRRLKRRIQTEHQGTGSAQDNLNLEILERIEFDLPPLAEQRAIAGVLGALDDKIEANRRMNATLEALARALFKSWFVDFDPVRGKMEGPTPALAADLAALFPDRLTEGRRGSIPEGWEFAELRNVFAKANGEIRTGPFGSQLHQSDYKAEGTPVVMPANLIDGTIDETDIARIGAEDVERLSDHKLKLGDIVYGRRGDIGRKALTGDTEEGWLCGTGCLRIRSAAERCPPLYLFQYLGLDHVREWIARRAVGATMPNLNTGILGEVEVLLPSSEVAKAFGAIAGPLDSAVRTRRRQSRTLVQLRDLLLPKLLSGALRVRDAERMIGDAA